ncbi:hypothetical protein GGS23DRAFT_604153 [Durotheca rogersii]|uniref:uncharacterized protein n=1 Tax=Durotheca rogersii TaxID=419775 RepID=UPI00221FD5E7|nr:uncharacterized protein GGS23DRAFT_604153 [Durotheca rogersii]KAI5864510.1 hypothetical protein GGS23DRAFT_604153 [Durotheca rogersii]
MSIDKKDPSKDESEESIGSSPENEPGPSVPPENQPAKRKGGRKPIYATSEERKQRNRQAQAAFRERRTEYIKQLEETIKAHESNLASLQAAHRSAADECLMLRYKNSLLERILLEKGIDVQAELHAKTGSPNLGPTHMPQNMVQPPPMPRTILSRHHHSRRSGSSIAPKLEPGIASLSQPTGVQQSLTSPKTRPTPPSHATSPTNPTPPFGSQVASSPASSDHTNLRATIPPPTKPQLAPMPGMAAAARQQLMQQHAGPRPPTFYPTSSFQNHFQQLGKLTQQEYDAPTDMMDEPEPDTPGPGPYPSTFQVTQPHGISVQPTTAGPSGQSSMASGGQGSHTQSQTQGQGYPSMTQLLDPALDWDPFGLSASMAFPTQFSFDTSNMR